MNPFVWLIFSIIDLYWWIILATVVISWLTSFNIINNANPYVRQIARALYTLTEPVLGPIRRVLPDLGGLDFSPVVVLFALQFLKQFIAYYLLRYM